MINFSFFLLQKKKCQNFVDNFRVKKYVFYKNVDNFRVKNQHFNVHVDNI